MKYRKKIDEVSGKELDEKFDQDYLRGNGDRAIDGYRKGDLDEFNSLNKKGPASLTNDSRNTETNNCDFRSKSFFRESLMNNVNNEVIYLYSKVDIEPGDELYVTYGANYWHKDEL